jgi:hypothetical protein
LAHQNQQNLQYNPLRTYTLTISLAYYHIFMRNYRTAGSILKKQIKEGNEEVKMLAEAALFRLEQLQNLADTSTEMVVSQRREHVVHRTPH